MVNPQIYGAGVKRQAKVLSKERGHPAPTKRDKADAAKVRAKLLDLAPAFGALLDYLKRQATAFAALGLPFRWTLADGFEALQDSRMIRKSKTSYWIPGLPKQITYSANDPTEAIDAEYQAREIGANYIHSFDALFHGLSSAWRGVAGRQASLWHMTPSGCSLIRVDLEAGDQGRGRGGVYDRLAGSAWGRLGAPARSLRATRAPGGVGGRMAAWRRGGVTKAATT